MIEAMFSSHPMSEERYKNALELKNKSFSCFKFKNV